MERIFERLWIYIGHESQVKQPGDYYLAQVGRQPMIMVRDETIQSRDLAFLNGGQVGPTERFNLGGAALTLHEARERFEREYILKALAAQRGNMSRTAKALGVERSNLYRKMRAFRSTPARKSDSESA